MDYNGLTITITHGSMFQTARPIKVFQDVVTQIQDAILDGRLKTGDTLPAERELKAMFNVSRGTLREALRVLEQKGLIEIKLGVGGGSIVKTVDSNQISESLGLLIRSQRVSLDHLAEFREDVEGIVAAHAAARRTTSDVNLLKQLLDQARKWVSKGASRRNAFIEIDKRIHLALADITGNPVYASVLHSIHANIHRYYDRFLSLHKPELQENFQDLCDLVDAVAKADVDGARRIAQRHVKRFNRYMQTRQSRQGQ